MEEGRVTTRSRGQERAVSSVTVRPFDVLGAISVAALATVLALDLAELRWSRREIAVRPTVDELDEGFREGVA
jgi:hypothetical protein